MSNNNLLRFQKVEEIQSFFRKFIRRINIEQKNENASEYDIEKINDIKKVRKVLQYMNDLEISEFHSLLSLYFEYHDLLNKTVGMSELDNEFEYLKEDLQSTFCEYKYIEKSLKFNEIIQYSEYDLDIFLFDIGYTAYTNNVECD